MSYIPPSPKNLDLYEASISQSYTPPSPKNLELYENGFAGITILSEVVALGESSSGVTSQFVYPIQGYTVGGALVFAQGTSVDVNAKRVAAKGIQRSQLFEHTDSPHVVRGKGIPRAPITQEVLMVGSVASLASVKAAITDTLFHQGAILGKGVDRPVSPLSQSLESRQFSNAAQRLLEQLVEQGSVSSVGNCAVAVDHIDTLDGSARQVGEASKRQSTQVSLNHGALQVGIGFVAVRPDFPNLQTGVAIYGASIAKPSTAPALPGMAKSVGRMTRGGEYLLITDGAVRAFGARQFLSLINQILTSDVQASGQGMMLVGLSIPRPGAVFPGEDAIIFPREKTLGFVPDDARIIFPGGESIQIPSDIKLIFPRDD